MKKIIGIVIASLMFCNIGFAEMRLIEEKLIKGKRYNNVISTVCIDGYKFVYMRSGSGTGRAVSIVQFWTDQSFHKKLALPGEC